MKKNFSVLVKSKVKKFNKKITVDPDKSISHRSYIIASQCFGISKIKALNSEDVKATIGALKKLGIKILRKNNIDYVYGSGISGFKKFEGTINCYNSGTSARSLLGILACYPYPVKITGDESLKLRPFKRLTNYLESNGAIISHPKNKKYTLPIKIIGTKDWSLAQKHFLKVKSAQLSSALIYAGIQTNGVTEIIESAEVRDHTQRMLKSLKADINVKYKNGKRITKIKGNVEMSNFSINVPADPSSACFFVVQTLLAKNSSLLIKRVCVNDTRIGFIKILKKMGAKIKIINKKKYFGESIGDIFVKSSKLRGVKCPSKLIVKSIDDLLAVWVACGLAKGKSHFKDIDELRFKESDRIKSGTEILNKLGIKTYLNNNSITICGNPNLKLNKKVILSSNLDHRKAITSFIAASVLGVKILIKNFETVASSFPNFLKLQKKIIGVKYEIKKNY